MKYRFIATLAAFCLLPGILRAQAPGSTTVVLVRHAEKAADDPRDPTLTPLGAARAEALVGALRDADLAAVYATQYRRTRSTAEPAARHFGLEVSVRPIDASNAATYAADLAQEIRSAYAGRAVLIVGHSNTVPALVEAFSGRAAAPIGEDAYDGFYVVVLPPEGASGQAASVLQARYGREGH